MGCTTVREAAQLIQMEYLETARLKMTFRQVQRLCDLSGELCDEALRALVESGFLARTTEGNYVRGGSDFAPCQQSVQGLPVAP